MTNSPELEPCPFCGGEAVMCAPYVNENILGHQVCCTNKKCGGTTRMFPTPEDAAAAWNRCAADTPSNAATTREALATIRKRLVAPYESEAGFMRYSPNRPLVDLIDAALASPPRNCDKVKDHSDAIGKFEKWMGFSPKTADEQDAFFKEHWFEFAMWLIDMNESEVKDGGK